MSEDLVRARAARFFNGKGQLQAVPAKQDRKIELLDFLALSFDADRRYSEKEVNELLEEFYYDFPYLRRMLIENNYLDRDSATGMYWKLERVAQ
ncbi:MAG: hypothetical protein RL441_85 [Actinomycetota bacterium]|jgi:hypothetical protein